MSSVVEFDELSESGRTPGVFAEFNARLASSYLPTNRQTVRIIAQRIATNSPVAASNTPVTVFSAADAATIFGAGSQCHLMARAAFRANPSVALGICAVDDPVGGEKATGSLGLTGTATKSGSVILQVASIKVSVAVAKGDTGRSVLIALRNLLAQYRPEMPVTFTFNSAAVDDVMPFTAKNKGIVGNSIPLALKIIGVTGLTSTLTPMAGGDGVPSLTAALAAIYALGDNVLVTPFDDTTSVGVMRTHIEAVSGGGEMRGTVGVIAHTGSYGTAVAMASSINSSRVLLAWLRNSPAVAYEVSAAVAAVAAGEEDPARPLNGLALAGIAAPAAPYRPSGGEVEACLYNGVTPLVVSADGRETVQIKRAVMTYTKSDEGMIDPSWLDITSIRTMDYVRMAWRQMMVLQFPREKMTARTIRAIRSATLNLLLKCEDRLEILQNVMSYKDQLIFVPSDQQAGTLVGRVPCNVVPGLHRVMAVFDLIL